MTQPNELADLCESAETWSERDTLLKQAPLADRIAALEAEVGRLREVMACQVNSHTNDCSCPVCAALRNQP